MLDANLKNQLKAYLQKVAHPIELETWLGDDAKSQEMRELLHEIVELSDRIRLTEIPETAGERVPAFTVNRIGADMGIRFAGIPMGHEFTSLVLALLQAGGHPPKIDADTIAQIRLLDGEYNFETYISLTCQNCPEVVQSLNLMAVLNPKIRHTMIDGALFQDEVNARQIMAVPTVMLNGAEFGQGRMDVNQILAKLDTGAAARAAAKVGEKAPFDMLVIGGGPAGAAAAIYAARKGIRTGVLAERFGGQLLDTLGIENFISVKETEGPRLAGELEQHVRSYEVDVMHGLRAEGITANAGEMVEVKLAGGAVAKAKAVILATGARWRELNVPGEREHRGRGVAYCPHCDGPLFKGKRVAVVGGGNSGVEAAIDLANIVSHVTLIEFDQQLRADAVLQKKLASLPNVKVITSAKTTEVTGKDGKVNGLIYEDRDSGEKITVELEGVFVQIGLLPNTEWLKGTINLSRHGEIEVDARGQTSLPGVFAAGDVTTVPFKQIVVAMGEGSKAALGAFDYLIRSSVPA
ncbi:MAG TPA: alkyl hydroperoxide reductase subunit F [Burkholderiales bacterium]